MADRRMSPEEMERFEQQTVQHRHEPDPSLPASDAEVAGPEDEPPATLPVPNPD
jgi:hypothetical protein